MIETNIAFLLKLFCMLSLAAITPVSCFTKPEQPTVVVIGAGLAGLTTAYRLQQKGADVHIYEARNRVGGRILTAKIGSDIVELGGQNISDGGDAENIYRLIDELHLKLKKHRVNLAWRYFNGKTFVPEPLLDKEEFNPESLKLRLTLASEKASNMLDVLNTLLTEEDPLHHILSIRLAGYEGAPPLKLSTLYTDTLYHMLLGGICSAHPGVFKEENTVDIVSLEDGNAALPEKLAALLGEKVHLNMPLLAISKTKEGFYELTFEMGQKVKADILVLAIPCSVYEDIAFEENVMPKERLELIKSVQYGTNAKILIPFPKPPPQLVTFISDRMSCFFADPNILTLYYTKEAGRFSENTILEAYRQERPLLESGFADLCPPFLAPVYAQDKSMLCYTSPLGYSWPNDPYAKGSYSYIAPGQEILLTSLHVEDGEKVRTLFAPIDGRLFIAGEHASILLDVPGTLEAACESGERTARMIEKSLIPNVTQELTSGNAGASDLQLPK